MLQNITVFRLTRPVDTELDSIDFALHKATFIRYTPTRKASVRFVNPSAHNRESLTEVVDSRHLIMRVSIDTRATSASMVREKVRGKVGKFKPNCDQKYMIKWMRELTEDIKKSLLTWAPAHLDHVWIWVDLGAARVIVGTTNKSHLAHALRAFDRALPDFPVARLQAAVTPAAATAHWLLRAQMGLWPKDLLLQRSTSRGLRMRHADRVSFTLTPDWQIEKIRFLGGAPAARDDLFDPFEAEMAPITSELTNLLDSLIPALGGRVEVAIPAETTE